MAALQLFKGEREPFLGMGAVGRLGGCLALERRRAGRPGAVCRRGHGLSQHGRGSVPVRETGRRPAAPIPTERQPREFLTAWAAGNPRSDPSHVLPGSNLQARGFGSLTMRPRISQVVQAQGGWKDGRWTVVLRRPLPGPARTPAWRSRRAIDCSIAFALWDGAAHDRNGQKLVSIWHDLTWNNRALACGKCPPLIGSTDDDPTRFPQDGPGRRRLRPPGTEALGVRRR